VIQRMMVDTWFWLALKDRSDQDHTLAVLANEEFIGRKVIYVTTNFVLDETYTLLRRRVSPQVAIAFGREIRQATELGAMEIVRVTAEMEQEAWVLFERYEDVIGLSYTDCTTFAAMRKSDLACAVTNDRHFAMMGFSLEP